MTAVTGIAMYLVIWWIVLFAILPFGVRPTTEPGGRGQMTGAPEKADDAEESPMDDARSGDRLGTDFCGCSVGLAAGARRAGAAAPARPLKPAGS